ncbi:MAG: methylated-DNA--[protein]-cysteine S-methyltransferase [Alphaproteobacteria bacterium]
MTTGYSIFETALGFAALAWGERGVVRVVLPERSAADARAVLLRRGLKAEEVEPPPNVRKAIEQIAALLKGEPADFSGIKIDLGEMPEFSRRVYDVARAIPPGSTLTYGEVAARLGQPGAAREVGQAMGANPVPIVIPCHRVVAASGKIGGFSAPGGSVTKQRLLAIEAALQPGTLFSKR